MRKKENFPIKRGSLGCDLGGKGKGGLKAKRSLLVRDANRRYASNFCKAAQTS